MLGAAVFLSLTAGRQLLGLARRPEAFRAWIDGCGPWAPLCLIGLMCFQVVVAVLPGEPIEIGAGVAFGVWQGLGLCLIGAALGLIFLLLRIPLPQPVEKTVSDIGGMATPYCLIVLGGSIHLSRFGDYGRSLWLAVLGKSVIIPLVFIPLVVLAGFRGDALAALAVMLACPTAVSGYTLANQCGADGELAAQLIVVTTLFSVVTMFLTIWVLTSMALI